MWQMLANGEAQIHVELFYVTLHVDRYIRYVISDEAHGVFLSGSEDTIAAALNEAQRALRNALEKSALQKDQIERMIQVLVEPLPLRLTGRRLEMRQ